MAVYRDCRIRLTRRRVEQISIILRSQRNEPVDLRFLPLAAVGLRPGVLRGCMRPRFQLFAALPVPATADHNVPYFQ